MKLPDTPSDYNAIIPIIKLIGGRELKPLTINLIDSIGSALCMGKIECESREEVVNCLQIMDELGVITVIKKQEPSGTSYLIGNV
jgi:hypothetical protein